MKKISPSPAGIPGPILAMDTSNRPPGISVIEFMTYQYEVGRGIKSTLTTKVEAAMKNTSAPTASASTRPTSLYSFIRSGQIAAGTTERDMRVMLDLARDLILSYGEHARAAAPPAPAPAPATVTAAAMLAAIAKPKMTVAEFNKFPHGQRGEIIKKIQLID